MKQLLFLLSMVILLTFNHLAQAGCSGECENGFGTFTYPSGDNYVGQWNNGKRLGQGTYIWANGDKYVGDWKDGNRIGQGTFTWGKGKWHGDKYVGDFQNGKKHGHGTYTWANGNQYVGDWNDDKKHGHGTQSFADGTQKSGHWENDNYIGPRRIVHEFLGEDYGQALEFLLLGTILVSGFAWQLFLFKKDKGPRRIYIPLIFSLIVVVGVLAHGVISLIDERNVSYSINELANNLWVVVVFGVGFVFKAYFFPILLSGVLAFVTYNFFEFNEFYAVPVFKEFLEFVFAALPGWLEIFYVVSSGIYIFTSTIHDTIS